MHKHKTSYHNFHPHMPLLSVSAVSTCGIVNDKVFASFEEGSSFAARPEVLQLGRKFCSQARSQAAPGPSSRRRILNTMRSLVLTAILHIVLGAELMLIGHNSKVNFATAGASLSVSCGEVPAVGDVGALVVNETTDKPEVTVRLLNVPPTCVGTPAASPCAAHSSVHPSLKRSPLFYCGFTTTIGTVSSGPFNAFSNPVQGFDGTLLAVEVLLTCKVPLGPELGALVTSDYLAASFNVSVSHMAPDGPSAQPLPYVGVEGDNVVSVTLPHPMPPPPEPPSPPLPPTPPTPPAAPPSWVEIIRIDGDDANLHYASSLWSSWLSFSGVSASSGYESSTASVKPAYATMLVSRVRFTFNGVAMEFDLKDADAGKYTTQQLFTQSTGSKRTGIVMEQKWAGLSTMATAGKPFGLEMCSSYGAMGLRSGPGGTN